MKYLITGGAGFIGHHVIDTILNNSDDEIVIIDRLDCSGNLNRLDEIGCRDQHKSRVKFIHHNLRSEFNDLLINQVGPVDVVLHIGAATHVDRSIENPMEFVLDNVVATANILDFARLTGVEQFLYFSTDEVFGPAPEGVAYREWARYKSGNPYAATKAGGEELCVAYHNTYGLPVKITHTMNVFGERQHPEKFIPMTISNVRKGNKVTIHSNKEKTRAGSRFYIHAKSVASAVMFVLRYGRFGEKYNIVGEREVSNLELAQAIADVQGLPLDYEMVDFHSARPGHDLRYALDGTRLESMGWVPEQNFKESLTETVDWTLKNNHWLI